MKTGFEKISILTNTLTILLFFVAIGADCRVYPEEIIFKVEGQKKYTFSENLLVNPGFEKMEGWNIYGEGYTVTTEITYSGNQSVKIDIIDSQKHYGAYQVVSIDFEENDEQKIAIGGRCRHEGEGDSFGRLYADVYPKDGSAPQYGLIVDFNPKQKNQWQYREKIFTIKRPSNIVLYVTSSGQKGSPVYFDDLLIATVKESVGEGLFFFDDTVVTKSSVSKNKQEKLKYSLATQDGFSIALTKNGKVANLTIAKESFVSVESTPMSGFFVRDVANDSDFLHVGGEIIQKGDKIQQKAKLESLKLEFESIFIAMKDYIQVRGKIKNLTTEDRAITIYFALPVDASGWNWWKNLRSPIIIQERDKEYQVNEENIGGAGKSALYPISSISKDINLSYGIRLDEPRIIRMSYNLAHKLYYIAFDLGLSPLTEKFPNQVDFSFIIYKSNPEWGFRSAIKRYYNFYPEFFVKRVDKEGIWLPGTSILRKAKNIEDFGFMFHHGLRDVDMGNHLGIYSCNYVAMQLKVHCLYDAREKPTIDEIINSIKNKDDTGELNLILNSALSNESGELYYEISKVGWFVDKIKGKADERGWSWCGIFHLNPDPEIPKGIGQQTYETIFRTAHSYEEKGMTVDGVSFDGISSSYLNFRREHFKYVDIPLSFDYITKKPAIVDAFSNYEFLRCVAEKQHSLGKIVMANGFPAYYIFASHLIDTGNTETSAPFSDSEALRIRTLLYQKPHCYMLKGDFSLSDFRSQIESYMKKSLFYGIFVTAFNEWGGGEDTNYFEHPEWYEADQQIFKKYVPLVKEISHAGWEPVTYATSSDPDVYIERYGYFKENNLYFTLLNSTSLTKKDVTLTFQAKNLGLKNKVRVEDVFEKKETYLEYEPGKELLKLRVLLLGNDVKLFKIEE